MNILFLCAMKEEADALSPVLSRLIGSEWNLFNNHIPNKCIDLFLLVTGVGKVQACKCTMLSTRPGETIVINVGYAAGDSSFKIGDVCQVSQAVDGDYVSNFSEEDRDKFKLQWNSKVYSVPGIESVVAVTSDKFVYKEDVLKMNSSLDYLKSRLVYDMEIHAIAQACRHLNRCYSIKVISDIPENSNNSEEFAESLSQNLLSSDAVFEAVERIIKHEEFS